MVQPIERPKGKPGRPTKEEQAAKGIVKTELDPALRLMKRHLVPSLEEMIKIAKDNQLNLDKKFKLWQDIVNMYLTLLKLDKSLAEGVKAKMDEAGITSDDDDVSAPTAVVFQLHK